MLRWHEWLLSRSVFSQTKAFSLDRWKRLFWLIWIECVCENTCFDGCPCRNWCRNYKKFTTTTSTTTTSTTARTTTTILTTTKQLVIPELAKNISETDNRFDISVISRRTTSDFSLRNSFYLKKSGPVKNLLLRSLKAELKTLSWLRNQKEQKR